MCKRVWDDDFYIFSVFVVSDMTTWENRFQDNEKNKSKITESSVHLEILEVLQVPLEILKVPLKILEVTQEIIEVPLEII